MVVMRRYGLKMRKRFIIIVLIFLVLNIGFYYFYLIPSNEEITVSASSISSRGSSPWTMCADIPTGRDWLTSGVINDTIFTVSGSSEVTTIECYDPGKNSWSEITSSSISRRFSTSIIVNNKIYLIGGMEGKQRSKKVECYDPDLHQWTILSDMPTARSSISLAEVDGKIYAMGGYNGDYLVTNECYDPITDTWSTRSNMLKARGYFTSEVINGIIYAIGGGNEKELSTVESYDPFTETHKILSSMPTPRSGPSSGVVDNKIYVFGGRKQRDSESWYFLSEVESYDPSSDSWFKCTDMPTGRSGSTAAAVNNKIYVIGGREKDVDYSHAVERYDPKADTLIPIEIDNFLDSLTSREAILIYLTMTILMILLSSIFVGTEVGKYALFSALNPMYTKERKRTGPGYERIKNSIRGYIIKNPGHSYNIIKRNLDLPNGTLTYNLKTLERAGLIKSERDGFHKRFYPGEARFVNEAFEFTDIQQSIYNVIKENPGISQSDIATRLYISIQRLNYNVKLMVDARIIRLDREGNKTKCFLIDSVERI
jgi:N-acetylneuraminic acid mutarotase/predicted transcriptional regulator